MYIKKLISRIFLQTGFILTLLILTSCAHINDPKLLSNNIKLDDQPIGVKRTLNLSKYKGMNFGGNLNPLPLTPYEVVITFDDGPNKKITPILLDELKKEQTNATFFMIGRKILINPDIAQKVIENGNSVGLHSLLHHSMAKLNNQDQIKDFEATKNIAQIILNNKSAPFYRFPHLRYTKNLADYANKNGFNIISADATSYDWLKDIDTQTIIKNIFNDLEKHNHSGIILLHDNRAIEIKAFPELLKKLKLEGYKIVKLDYSE